MEEPELGYKSEEVGFEPTKRFRVYTLSKRAPSATRTLLQRDKEYLNNSYLASNLESLYVRRMLKKVLYLLFIPLLLCSAKKGSLEKPIVLVTIAPYAYFVERIAQETVQTEILIPPGVNLHIYEPTPKQVEASIKAAVWLRIDEPFEKKMVITLKEKNPKQIVVNLQDNIDLLSDDAKELGSCQGHGDHHHGEEDLHTWLSPKRALQQAEAIFQTLVARFPEHKALYQKNFHTLSSDLQNLNQELKNRLLPFKNNAILVSHPALGYFCHDYQLIQLSVECEGKEPRPKDIEQLIHRAKSYSVRSVFLQQGYDNRGAQIIGEKLQLPIYQIDPYAKEYIKTMRQITDYIVQ